MSTTQIVLLICILAFVPLIVKIIKTLKPKKEVDEDAPAQKTDTPQKKTTKNFKKILNLGLHAAGIIAVLVVIGGGSVAIFYFYNTIENFIYPPPPTDKWVEEEVFGYTPNIPTWTTFDIVASVTGNYRVVCTNGYMQHNIPTNPSTLTDYIPCEGEWFPKTQPGNMNHDTGAQLVYVNGSDLTGGRTAITISKGETISISVMPNIGSIYNGARDVTPMFTSNTGRATFSLQRQIAQ